MILQIPGYLLDPAENNHFIDGEKKKILCKEISLDFKSMLDRRSKVLWSWADFRGETVAIVQRAAWSALRQR